MSIDLPLIGLLLLAGAILLLRPRRHIRIDQLYRITPEDLWALVVPSPDRPNPFETIERFDWLPGSDSEAMVLYRNGLKARLTLRHDAARRLTDQVLDLLDRQGRPVERLTCQVALHPEAAGTRLVMDIGFESFRRGGPLHWLTMLMRPLTARSLRLQIERAMERTGAADRFAAAHGPAPVPPSLLGMRISRGAALLAVVACGWWTYEFGPWLTLALVAGLVSHEAGHVAVMRAFGDRASAFYFLPFLGGVAVGRRRHGQDWHQAAMVLGGPLAGLGSALAALLLGGLLDSDYLVACAWFFAMLNLINLAPLPPLDGGQMILLALRPFLPRALLPYMGTGLLALTVALMLWAQWWLFGVLLGALLVIELIQAAPSRIPDRPALSRGQALALVGLGLGVAASLAAIALGIRGGEDGPDVFAALMAGPFAE